MNHLDAQFHQAELRILRAIDWSVFDAKAEIKAQAESARRSIGQRIRYAKVTGEKA